MNRVDIDIKNCYGIKSLQQQFNFSQNSVYAIYAPNGAMKSSLAQVFQDIANSEASKDRIFPTRVSTRKITDENGVDLAKESVLVVRPYDEAFGHSEKTSTLLVDAKLRKEYEELFVNINESKEMLLKAIREQSHSKKDLEKEISSAFTTSDDDFGGALTRIENELAEQKEAPFAEVYYDKIFDEKVLDFLRTKDVKTAIEDYVQRYNELLASSTYFKKGTFDFYNAAQTAKTLAKFGFFSAKHSLNLNAAEKLEISTQEELEDVIANEKVQIIKDKALRSKFEEIEKLVTKNVTLRDFQTYMAEHESLLSQMVNIEKFKEDILKSYLLAKYDLYLDLMTKIKTAAKRKKEIEEEATKQRTQWEDVIEIFNSRFFVPFKLSAKNRTAVILGYEPMISLGFTYHDGDDSVPIEKPALLAALSTGEKKALYVLNIIFEIETRKKANQETLIVVDDIADSFDYQNKYAIIQYLKDVSKEQIFKQIIMTHNFDFFRTVESRFVNYQDCLMASKSDAGISLEQAVGVRNIFINDWKRNFFTDPKKKIASIPFIRNLVEYTKGDGDPNFRKLTSLLHWKADSASISEADLNEIFNQTFSSAATSANGKKAMIDIILEEAQSCRSATVGINFENKIVLSIAIRIIAEQFMTKRIDDNEFVAAIDSNQTQRLLENCMEMTPRP